MCQIYEEDPASRSSLLEPHGTGTVSDFPNILELPDGGLPDIPYFSDVLDIPPPLHYQDVANLSDYLELRSSPHAACSDLQDFLDLDQIWLPHPLVPAYVLLLVPVQI